MECTGGGPTVMEGPESFNAHLLAANIFIGIIQQPFAP